MYTEQDRDVNKYRAIACDIAFAQVNKRYDDPSTQSAHLARCSAALRINNDPGTVSDLLSGDKLF